MFCTYLNNSYHFTYDNVKPCCWIKDSPRTQIRITDPELKEKFSVLRQIDDWIPECNYCQDLEIAGTSSPRTLSDVNHVFTDKDTDTVRVELQIDDDCNAACLICGAWNSSTWRQYEERTLKGKTYPSYKWKTTVDERISVVKDLVSFDSVKQLHFFGGEPFNTDTQLTFLKLIEHPESVNIIYITNGSIFPCSETIELWKRFKSVHIGISIDGVGDHFNYLRWPLQWHQIENNLKKYVELAVDNITINSSFTVTPFNIFYIDRYTQWAEEFSMKYDNNSDRISEWFLNPHPVVGSNMDMSCIPPDLKEMIIYKYGKDSRISKILSTDFDVQKCLRMINYLNFHDRHRKSNWTEIFPEIVEYFDIDRLSPLPKKRVWEIKAV